MVRMGHEGRSDHPAGGKRCAEAFRYGLGGEGLLVALFGQQGSFQLSEGLGMGIVVIGFQLLSELADGGGELWASMPSCQREADLPGAPCGAMRWRVQAGPAALGRAAQAARGSGENGGGYSGHRASLQQGLRGPEGALQRQLST